MCRSARRLAYRRRLKRRPSETTSIVRYGVLPTSFNTLHPCTLGVAPLITNRAVESDDGRSRLDS